VGDVVTVQNGYSNPGTLKRYVFTMLAVPRASALSVGVMQDGPLATWSFTPDVVYGYRIRVDVYDALGNQSTDVRVFGVLNTAGRFRPPLGARGVTNPTTGLVVDSEVNFCGQVLAWDPYIEDYLDLLDDLSSTDVIHEITNANYTVTETNKPVTIVVYGLTANKTITLSTGPRDGQRITVKDGDGSLLLFSLTISGAGQTIDAGGTSVVVNGAHCAWTWCSDGDNWNLVAEAHPRSIAGDSFTAVEYELKETSSPWANTGNGGSLNLSVMRYGSFGSSVFSRPTIFDNGLAFNGGELECTSVTTSVGELEGDFSASVWVVPSSLTGFAHIFGKRYRNDATWSAPFGAFGFYLNSSNDGSFTVFVTTSATQHTLACVMPFVVSCGKPSLLALTFKASNGQLKGYVDGALAGTSSTAAGAADVIDWGSHGPYYLAGLPNGSSQCFQGIIKRARAEPGVVRSAQYYTTLAKQGLRLLDS
jgi:hypothetical protein